MKASKTILILILAAAIVGFAIYIHAVRPQSNPISQTKVMPNPEFYEK